MQVPPSWGPASYASLVTSSWMPLHRGSCHFARTFDERTGLARGMAIGYDGSVLSGKQDMMAAVGNATEYGALAALGNSLVYVLPWQQMKLSSPIQEIDYIHSLWNGYAVAQTAGEDEHDIFAYDMIALKPPGVVATRIQNLQRRWRRFQHRRILAVFAPVASTTIRDSVAAPPPNAPQAHMLYLPVPKSLHHPASATSLNGIIGPRGCGCAKKNVDTRGCAQKNLWKLGPRGCAQKNVDTSVGWRLSCAAEILPSTST